VERIYFILVTYPFYRTEVWVTAYVFGVINSIRASHQFNY